MGGPQRDGHAHRSLTKGLHVITTMSPVSGAMARRPSGGSRCQVLLALLLVFSPLVISAVTANSFTYVTPMDLFENTLGTGVPQVFAVAVACFGCLTLTWRLNHRFVSLTRVREDVRRQLVRRAILNAAAVGAVFFAVVLVVAFVSFEVVPRLELVQFRPESLLNRADDTPFSAAQIRQHDLSSNAWSFLYAAGWPLYALVYGAYVAVSAALWATVGFVLVLLVPNRYLALSLPFLIIHIVDFVIQVLGAPQFSPLVSVFPYNISAQPLWTSFVPLSAVVLLAAVLAAHCWRRIDHLESLT